MLSRETTLGVWYFHWACPNLFHAASAWYGCIAKRGFWLVRLATITGSGRFMSEYTTAM